MSVVQYLKTENPKGDRITFCLDAFDHERKNKLELTVCYWGKDGIFEKSIFSSLVTKEGLNFGKRMKNYEGGHTMDEVDVYKIDSMPKNLSSNDKFISQVLKKMLDNYFNGGKNEK